MFMYVLQLCTLIFAKIGWAQQAEVRGSDVPFAINDLRLKPEFCGGFHITYPANHGTTLVWGEMGYLSWEIDRQMKEAPDLITRIRLLDDFQHNTQLIGENITIVTHGNRSAMTFPVNVHFMYGLGHYRIAVRHPGRDNHCVYESAPITIVPRAYERYTDVDTIPPAFIVPNARKIVAA